MHLPFLYFSQEDLAACQDEGLIRETDAIRDSAEATFQVGNRIPALAFASGTDPENQTAGKLVSCTLLLTGSESSIFKLQLTGMLH